MMAGQRCDPCLRGPTAEGARTTPACRRRKGNSLGTGTDCHRGGEVELGSGMSSLVARWRGESIAVTEVPTNGRSEPVSPALWEAIRSTYAGEMYLFETSGAKPLERSNVAHRTAEREDGVQEALLAAPCSPCLFATRMIGKIRKIQALSEYLGHAGMAVTRSMYTHKRLSDSEFGIGG